MSKTAPSQPPALSRRAALQRVGAGFGSLALGGLLGGLGEGFASTGSAARRVGPHFSPLAKRVIFLFMHGGPSQVETFDYKPRLLAGDGKPLPFDKPRVQFAKTGNLGRPRFEFAQHGESGLWISSLFPELARHADKLCMLHGVHGTNEAHGGAMLKLNTGSDSLVRPSMGSWITYGLGTDNDNLPGFLTLCPSAGHGGSANWGAAFLPASTQGTAIGVGKKITEAEIPYLGGTAGAAQRRQLEFLQAMNREHLASRGEDALEARIQSFETAFAMQMEAPEAMSIEGESEATRSLYGIGEGKKTDAFGRQCLLARRFAERGVRFIQINHGYWDQHGDLTKKHGSLAHACDRPIAGLLHDLDVRGLLEDTLVLWGGEFGRTPTLQGKDGRDHNPHGFTMWMAGGGTKGGTRYGATDEYGFYAQEGRVSMPDLHATLLYLLGLDHERLTFNHGGRDFRLTDVSGRVVREVVA